MRELLTIGAALSVFAAFGGRDGRRAKGVPEMLKGSIAFDLRGWTCVLDGCYADTAEIGYNVLHGATIRSSGFFNNPRMGLRKSTAIVHRGGDLTVDGCNFYGAAKCEKLYEGDGKNLIWSNVHASGGDKMSEDAAKLSAGRVKDIVVQNPVRNAQLSTK